MTVRWKQWKKDESLEGWSSQAGWTDRVGIWAGVDTTQHSQGRGSPCVGAGFFKALCISTCGWAKVTIMAFLVTMFTNRNSRDSLIIWSQGYVIYSGSLPARGSLLIRPVMCLGRLVRQRGTGGCESLGGCESRAVVSRSCSQSRSRSVSVAVVW